MTFRCSFCHLTYDKPHPYGRLVPNTSDPIQQYCYGCYMTIWRMSLVDDYEVVSGTAPPKDWLPMKQKNKKK
jgi:hypothetical protein